MKYWNERFFVFLAFFFLIYSQIHCLSWLTDSFANELPDDDEVIMISRLLIDFILDYNNYFI